MPLSKEQITAIQAWVKEEGCAIGGIYSQDGDLSVQLAMALCQDSDGHWQDMPNILYVRTTQLEARLLEQVLVQNMPAAEDYICVWTGAEDVSDLSAMVLTTYHVLQWYLRDHTGQDQPLFEDRTLVVFDHEMGVSVEGMIARDMLAVVASQLENQAGPWIRILGLSYYASPQEWLQHPCRLLRGPRGRISMDILIKQKAQKNTGSFTKATWDEDGVKSCAIEVARAMKKKLNVAVFSTKARFRDLKDAVEDLHAGEFVALKDNFWDWPEVGFTRENSQVFSHDASIAHMISMPHDGYPCALPFARIGMVVIMPPGPRRVYNERARVCLKTEISLTQAQLRIESGFQSIGQANPSVISFVGMSEALPKCPGHPINLEDDYLAGWLSAISIYPARPIDQLPFFGAFQSSAYSHDCLAQLQVMGLVSAKDSSMGFKLTQKGQLVKNSEAWLTNLSLSGLSALADVMSSLRGNLARSAVRMILLLEHYLAMVDTAARLGDDHPESVDELRSILRDMESSSTHGGPGRNHIDRGLLWAAWLVFEEAAFGMDLSVGNPEDMFASSEILPKVKNPPFFLRGKAVRDFVEEVRVWEHNLGLAPLRRNDWAGFRLSASEANSIQDIMARSYYPYLVYVPVRVDHALVLKHLGHSLYRSQATVRGSDPIYNLYKRMWAEDTKGQTRSVHVYTGLSSPPMGTRGIGNEIAADVVMIMPAGTALAVDKDGMDTWARANAGL